MSHSIPEPYKWDESFRVFYEQLDAEHRGLFDGIFACANSPSDGGALNSLVKLVDAHFEFEEGMMKKSGYPDYDTHHALHVDFVKKLKALKTPLGADAIKFAKEWLVNHIKNTDFKYKGKL